jgi:hypothetical protein
MDTWFWGQKVEWERFTVFNTPQEWFSALVAKIQNIQNGWSQVYSPDMTISQYIGVYAPASDNNNVSAYANSIAKDLWVSTDTKISELDPVKLASAHAKHEDVNSYRMLLDLGIINKDWTLWQWTKSEYSNSQQNVMSNISSITWVTEKALKAAWLSATDWANYRASSWKLSQQDVDNINKEQSSFNQLSQTKDWNSAQWVQEWLSSVWNQDLTWPEIQGLISNYAKILDPTSVVRESEYAMAQKWASQWVIDKTKQQIATFIAGGSNVLSADAQAVLKEAMQWRLNAMKDAYLTAAKRQVKQSNASGVPITLEQLTWETETPTPAATPAQNQADPLNINTPTSESDPLWILK